MRKISAFTLIEIMITLIIMGMLVAMSVFTLNSYLPRQRLLNATETVEQSLSRAQLEASSKSAWACVEFMPMVTMMDPAPDLVVRIDSDGDRNCENSDQLVTSQEFHPDISFATCSGSGTYGTENSFDFSSGGAVWFDSAGVPKICPTPTTCTPNSFQIVLRNPNLPDGNRAREVEAVSSGLIKIIDRNDKGFSQGIYAKSVDLTSGGCQ